MLPAGVGGTFGTLSGGIEVAEDGAAGDVDDVKSGGAGCGFEAVLLEVPGSTTASESLMLALTFESGSLESAKHRFWTQLVPQRT